jgi:DNA-binding NarL/FixJ family response regulator
MDVRLMSVSNQHLPQVLKSSSRSDGTDRLLDLFSTFSVLREDSRLLVQQLRGSITQIREVQQRPQTRPPAGRSPETADGFERYGLTRREQEVAELLAEGKSNATIARHLGISAHTARHHTQRVLSKLAVHSRAEAGAKLRTR